MSTEASSPSASLASTVMTMTSPAVKAAAPFKLTTVKLLRLGTFPSVTVIEIFGDEIATFPRSSVA